MLFSLFYLLYDIYTTNYVQYPFKHLLDFQLEKNNQGQQQPQQQQQQW